MKKQILSIAILATLPLTAMADNPVVSVGPAAVPANGTAVVATANPPYQTLTPSNDDKQHIASTAYVKGAYNDAIAAVNKVDSDKQAKLVEAGNQYPIVSNVVSQNNIYNYDYAFDDGAEEGLDLLGEGLRDDFDVNSEDMLLMTAGATIATVRNSVNRKQNKLLANGGDDDIASNVADVYDLDGGGVGAALPEMSDQDLNSYVDHINTYAGNSSDAVSLISARAILTLMHEMGIRLKGDTDDVADDLSAKRVTIYTTWDNDTAAATRKVELSTAQ